MTAADTLSFAGECAIYEAVSMVLSELPAIGKNRTAPGSMGGYAFRSIEDITAALKPLLAQHGVTIIPSILERRDSERPLSSAKVMFVTDLHVQFRFVALDGSSLVASMWGQGTDMGDKSPQKAVTSAFKSMLSVTFCISDAELDAEAHDVPSTERHRPAPKARVTEVAAMVKDAALEGWVKDQGFDWPWSADACVAIEAKAASVLEKPFVEPESAVEDGTLLAGGDTGSSSTSAPENES